MKFFYKNLFGIALFVAFSLGAIIPEQVRAFQITPARFTFFIDAGSSAGGLVTILNDAKINKNYKISILGARPGQNGLPEFGSGFDQAESWVELNKLNIKIDSGKKYDVGFTVDVPAGTAPGAHYIGIAAEEDSTNASGEGVKARLVSILYIQVAGEAREELKINSGDILPSNWWQKNKTWAVNINNTGNIPVAMRAEIKIKNSNSTVIYQAPVFLGGNLIPREERNLKIFLPFAGVSAPGIYKAEFQVVYGQQQNKLVNSEFIVYAPIWFLISSMLVLLCAIAGLYFYKQIHLKKVSKF